MNNILNDELDLIDVPAATTTDTAAVPVAAPAPAPAAAPSNIESWDADDADDVSKGVLKGSGVPYVKVAENQPVRIALVPNSKIVGAAVHYSQASSKYFICASTPGKRSACCDKLGDAKGRAAALCFVYKNADPQSAKLAPGTAPVVEIGIFTMSRSNYADLKNGVEEGQSVTDVDFRISVTPGQLTRKVAVISRVARWKEIQDAALALAAPFLADNSQLVRALGRKYETAASFDATLGDIEQL